MGRREVLVDSAGLYALADHSDSIHTVAERCVSGLLKAGVDLVLTDYIVDEACTLAKARAGGAWRVAAFGNYRSERGIYTSPRQGSEPCCRCHELHRLRFIAPA